MVRGGSEQTRRRFLTASATIGISTAIAGCSDLTGQFADSGATSLSYGASRELTLREGDGRDPEYGDLAKPMTFRGSSGDSVAITMTAEFDTHLVLEGPDGAVVAENDDIEFPSNTDSRIRTTLSADGEYTIWCGSFSGSSTGSFELSLERQ